MKLEDIEEAIKLLNKLQESMRQIQYLYSVAANNDGLSGEVGLGSPTLTTSNKEDVHAICRANIHALKRINDEIRTKLAELGVTI